MAMRKISTTTLSSSASQIVVDNIPSTYKSIFAYMSMKGDNTGGGRTAVKFSLNDDVTDANYNTGIWYREDGSYGGGIYTGSSSRIIASVSSGQEANLFGALELFIPNYASTGVRHSLFLHNANPRSASGGDSLWQDTILWTGTAAIYKMTFFSISANFVSGTSIDLYGIS